jgi:hypothetical protein
MRFAITVSNFTTREEFVALFDAIAGATPDDEQRDAELLAAFRACADRLLRNVEPDELARVMACISGPLSVIEARRRKQAEEERRLTRVAR